MTVSKKGVVGNLATTTTPTATNVAKVAATANITPAANVANVATSTPNRRRWKTLLVCVVSIAIGFVLSSWYNGTTESMYGPIRDWYHRIRFGTARATSRTSPRATQRATQRATVGQPLPVVSRSRPDRPTGEDERMRTILPSGDVLVGDGYNSDQQLVLYNTSPLLDDEMFTSQDTKTELRSMLSTYYDEEIPTMTV
jgi:hypothetical protein